MQTFVIKLPRERYAPVLSDRLEELSAEAQEIERKPKSSWTIQKHCRWMLAMATLRDLVTPRAYVEVE